MNDIALVEMAYAKNDLSDVESNSSFIKELLYLQVFAQVTTIDERHHKIEAFFCREKIMHIAQVFVVSLEKYLELRVHRLNRLAVLNELVLSNVLNCKPLSWMSLERELSEEDSAKTTLTKLLQDLEIAELHVWHIVCSSLQCRVLFVKLDGVGCNISFRFSRYLLSHIFYRTFIQCSCLLITH